ncbi:MAG: M3 family oligoendopeptidase [Bacteroidia bacterium]|nr:M3 family oligoendopeptidase [Bacteroidia bacterium]
MNLRKHPRIFLPTDYKIENWEGLQPHYQKLLSEDFHTKAEFESWLKKVSELQSAVSEDLAWRYIHMTCDTANKTFEESYLEFVTNIQPHLAPFEDKLNKKLAESPYLQELEQSDKAYMLYFRQIKTAIELYREENIALNTKIQTLAQEYSAINGQMEVEWEGKKMTLQQAAAFLKDNNRDVREKVYTAIQEERYSKHEKLDDIFSEMISLRHQVALNAGFKNYRDYKFKELNRFDYTVKDCFDFHHAIEKVVVPLKKKLHKQRKEKLGLAVLKPWDTSVDADNKPKLHPFDDGEDLLNKTIAGFNRIDPFFSDCISTMKAMKHLDLESRKGKAPGGYNYPLAETGVPFIFMNAASLHRDVETMVHEGGHAIHSFLTRDLSLEVFKETPSEVAELASMSMELLSMEVWDEFYPNADDHKRAMREQLEGIIFTLPWIATVDAFQHWIYENPMHSKEERMAAWNKISDRFETGLIDYTGVEKFKKFTWHAQLHIFEIPFYYIEYGFAQLGAIGVWKNYKAEKNKGIEDYKTALKAGYTKPIPEIYALAGVEFGCSERYIQQLFEFVWAEL